jgi:hypothetical protein
MLTLCGTNWTQQVCSYPTLIDFQAGDQRRLTFTCVNLSSVNTSNLEVMPGANPSKSGLICVEYFLYIEGTSAISAIARLRAC